MKKENNEKKLLKKIDEEGQRLERELHGCGRCSLAALLKYLHMVDDEKSRGLLLSAVVPLSGGISGTRNTCGAILGGLMALGLEFFPDGADNADVKDIWASFDIGRKYYRRVEKELGHSRCFDIRQANLGRLFDSQDPEEYKKFVEAGGYDLCSRVVGTCARLAAETIFELRKEREEARKK
jgi:C_GCAxxG_C_C family probable redox protein